MQTRTKIALIAGAAVAAIAIGTGVGIAGGGDDAPLTGAALEQASEAALAHVGGGTVVETEVGDGSAAYGIEVRLDDGRVVEVNLDADFRVIGSEADDDGASGEETGGSGGEEHDTDD